MRVTILGNNSALPAFGRHPTAQTVTVYGEVLLLDCGEGTQLQMQRYGQKWKNVHHIFISHMHGDHYFGLPGLVNSMSLLGRTAPLNIYAPAGLEPILDLILRSANTELKYPLHFHRLSGEGGRLVESPTFSVDFFPVEHGIECYGFLVETKTRGRRILPEKCKEYNIPVEHFEELKDGNDFVAPDGAIIKNAWVTAEGPEPKRYAYCTDTLFTERFLPLIQGVDMIYHESTYLEEDEDKAIARFHSTATQAAELARMANAKHLLLGHFSSKYKELEPFREQAARIFPNVTVSVEGVAYDL
ncbi:MAG: ribonuclease Z [Taibaiella sp.]|nr:ribonuclease Z [Taibaiella sp.]